VFAQALINLVALAILATITITSLALIRGHATALIATVAVRSRSGLWSCPARRCSPGPGAPTTLTSANRGLAERPDQPGRRGLRVFTKPRLGAGAIVAQLAA
jgi:hypothetical protein